MSAATERLQSLSVADVMSKAVVQVSSHQMMSEAAELFVKHEISAAPVVDEQGHCVGVLSASDFLKRDSTLDLGEESLLAMESHHLVQDSEEEPLHIVSSAENLVCSYMTTAVQTIPAGASLLSAARIMSLQHIHRLLVIDKQERPVGILSTMDIVSALVNAIEEMESAIETHVNK